MMTFVGQPISPIGRQKFTQGLGQYLDDLNVPGACYAAFLRSPHASARILSINTTRAFGKDIMAVLTAADILHEVDPIHAEIAAPGYFAPKRPLLPTDQVRFVGEPVAVVVATSVSAALDAVELIEVQYEVLPAVVNMEHALEPTAPLVHDAVKGNVLFRGEQLFGDIAARFAEADITVAKRFTTGRITGVPLEPRGCIAIPDPGVDSLTVWLPSQAPHIFRTILSECLKIPESSLRIRVPDVGGGFGIKIHIYPEEVLVAHLARRLRVPVKWIQARMEDLQASAHCREQIYELELAARRNGEFLALRARVLTDNGAFALPPQGAVLQPASVIRILPGAYRLGAYACEYLVVATNKSPAGAYRGVGQPAAIFAIERLVDILAARLQRDPADLRRQNMVRENAPSLDSITHNEFDNASFRHSLEKALHHISYNELRLEQAANPNSGIGIGIAIYPENTGLGSSGWRARGVTRIPGFDSVHIRILPDATVTVASSVPEIGQGHETALIQIVAQELGVSLDRVRVEHTDTAATMYGTGCFASRGSIAGGGAALRAAGELKKKVKKIAGLLMECSEADVVIENNRASITGVPDLSVSLEEITRVAHYLTPGPLPAGVEAGLEASDVYDPPAITFANGCHVAVVRVDPEIGAVHILQYLVVHDCGRVINPILVEGQIRGAVAQGIASTLAEQLLYDADGQFVTGSLLDYSLPRAVDVPSKFEVVDLDYPSPSTEGGFKGIGESGIIGAPAAVSNAIADAFPAVGPALASLPITRETLWRLLEAQSQHAGTHAKGASHPETTPVVSR